MICGPLSILGLQKMKLRFREFEKLSQNYIWTQEPSLKPKYIGQQWCS